MFCLNHLNEFKVENIESGWNTLISVESVNRTSMMWLTVLWNSLEANAKFFWNMISLHLTMSTFCVCIDVLGILVWQMGHQIQDNGIIERTMYGMEWYIIFIDILLWNRPTVYLGAHSLVPQWNGLCRMKFYWCFNCGLSEWVPELEMEWYIINCTIFCSMECIISIYSKWNIFTII